MGEVLTDNNGHRYKEREEREREKKRERERAADMEKKRVHMGKGITRLWLKTSGRDLNHLQRIHAETGPRQWLKTRCHDLILPLVPSVSMANAAQCRSGPYILGFSQPQMHLHQDFMRFWINRFDVKSPGCHKGDLPQSIDPSTSVTSEGCQ